MYHHPVTVLTPSQFLFPPDTVLDLLKVCACLRFFPLLQKDVEANLRRRHAQDCACQMGMITAHFILRFLGGVHTHRGIQHTQCDSSKLSDHFMSLNTASERQVHATPLCKDIMRRGRQNKKRWEEWIFDPYSKFFKCQRQK